MPDPGASHAYTRLGRFALIVTTLLLGSSFTIMKDALATVPALWLLAIRFSGAAMLMALIGIRSLRRLDRGYLTGGACMGVCLYLAYTIQTYGLVHTTPGKNAFLAATYCVFVPFFWWLIHKRRPDRYNLAAALLCLCGMGLVSRQSDLRIGRGEGLTILSGVFYALHIIATASAARGRSPVLLSFVQFAVAAVLSWVTAPFAAPAPEEIPADVWLRLGYLCVMCTGLCFLLQTFGQKYAPPTTAALLLTLHTQGRKLAIVSNKPDEAVRALRADFFADAVQIAVGETAAIRRKPAPDMLLAAMEQLGADPDKTVFVGDSEVDIATARAADLPCISVLWGFRDRDVLERAGAQQFAADIAQLQALLG